MPLAGETHCFRKWQQKPLQSSLAASYHPDQTRSGYAFAQQQHATESARNSPDHLLHSYNRRLDP
jgi:hypothetical protein